MITKKQKNTYLKFKKRISNGIKLLDKEFGRNKWLEKIDLKMLDLSDGEVCMVGQLFGSFWDSHFKSKNITIYDMEDSGEEYGFYLNSGEEGNNAEYDFLTNLWYVKIVDLKLKAGLIP